MLSKAVRLCPPVSLAVARCICLGVVPAPSLSDSLTWNSHFVNFLSSNELKQGQSHNPPATTAFPGGGRSGRVCLPDAAGGMQLVSVGERGLQVLILDPSFHLEL